MTNTYYVEVKIMRRSGYIVIMMIAIVIASPLAGMLLSGGMPWENETRLYATHSPIRINSNTDFGTQASNEGWAGSGTSTDPYIIENYEISGGSSDGIYIGNTTVYFIIRNCYIHDNNESGIEFYNVKNGRIENSTVEKNMLHASHDGADVYVNASISSNTYIVDTTASGGYSYGIIISQSSDVHLEGYIQPTVDYLYIEKGSEYIYVSGYNITKELDVDSQTTDIYIENNTFYNAPLKAGEILDGGSSNGAVGNVYIKNNKIEYTGTGFAIGVNSTNFLVMNNTVVGKVIFVVGNGDVISNTLNGIGILARTYLSTDKIDVKDNQLTNATIYFNSNTVVENNVLKNISSSVFWVIEGFEGSNVQIRNNTILNCTANGIYLNGVTNAVVTNNTIVNVSKGIYLQNPNNVNINSNNIEVYNNTISQSSMGIYLYNVTAISIFNNNISSNTNGMQLNLTNNIQIYNNTIGWNGKYGIYFGDKSASNTQIHDNVILHNPNYGVVIENGTGNRFWNNTFYKNNGATDSYSTLHIQARDDVGGNYWNTSGTPHGFGNYWNDWTSPDNNNDGIVDNSYSIDGLAGTQDYYPRTITFIINITSMFSPNGDGYNDTCLVNVTAPISYYFWVKVSNSSGVVKTYKPTQNATANFTWVWNGTNLTGSLASTGTYTITVYGSNGYLNKSNANTTYLDVVIPALFYKSGVEGGSNNTIINTSNPLFTWTGSSDANTGLWEYRLIINNTPDCSSPLYAFNLSSSTTSYRVYNMPDGTYYWWVLAIDKVNNGRFADGGAYWNGTSFITTKWWWRFKIDTVKPWATNFTVEPTPYSPNGDGRHDVLYINLTFSENLEQWAITIYNSTGSPVSSATWTGNGNVAKVSYSGSIPEGNYRVHVYMKDYAGNTNTTDKWFLVDLTPLPAPTITQPPNNYYTNNFTVTIKWTSPSDLANWSHDVVEISYTSNSTVIADITVNTTNFQINYTFTVDGNYTIKVYRYDTAGNVNVSNSVSIHVDTKPPTPPTLVAPADNSYVNTNTVNFTWSHSNDTSPLSYTLYLYYPAGTPWKEFSTNNTWYVVDVSSFSTTQTLYWNVSATDEAGNSIISQQTYSVIIDHQPPTFSYTINPHTISPNGDGLYDKAYINGTSTSNSGEPLKWRVEIYSSTNLIYYNETTAYVSTVSFVWDGTNMSGSVMSDGNYTVKIIAYDDANNSANQTGYVIIDLPPPTINSITYENYLIFNNSENITINATDFSGISAYGYAINGTFVAWFSTNNFTIVLPNGEANYTITIYVKDTFGHVATANIWIYEVQHRPTGSISVNEHLTNNATITLHLSASDSVFSIVGMSIKIDNGVWENYSYATSLDVQITTDGNHTIYVKFITNLGVESEIYSTWIVVDTAPPTTSVVSQLPQYTNATSITFTVSGTDSLSGFAYYKVYISINGGAWQYVGTYLANQTTVKIIFSQEGKYNISVVGFDRAGNYEDTKVKATIVVDWTNPALNINTQNTTLTLTFSHTISWNGTDNNGIAYYLIYIYKAPLTKGEAWKVINTTDTSMTITFDDNATYTIIIRAYDKAGNFAEKTLTITENYNYPPEITKTDIPTNTTAGQETTFYADAVDVKGDNLNYTWILDNKTVGYGQYLKIKLPKGNHTLELIVSDGVHNVTRTWNITVKPASKSGGIRRVSGNIMDLLMPILSLILLLIVVLIVFMMIMKRRKKPEEKEEGLSEGELAVLNQIKGYLEHHNGEKIETVVEAVSGKMGKDKSEVLLVLDYGASKGVFTKESDADGNLRVFLTSRNLEIEEKKEEEEHE